MEFVLWLTGGILLAFAVGYLVGHANVTPWHTFHLLRLEWNVRTIKTYLEKVMTKAEAEANLDTFLAQLTKAKNEIVGKIQELVDSANAANDLPQSFADKITALGGLSQNLDDIVPG